MNRRISLRYILFVICMFAALLPTLMVSSWVQHQVQQNETATVHEKHLLIARNLSTALARYANDTAAIFSSANQQISLEHFHNDLSPLLKEINLYALFEWQQGRGQRFFYGESSLSIFNSVPAQVQVAMEQARANKNQVYFSGVVVEGVPQPTIFLAVYQGQDRFLMGALGTQYLLESQSEVRFGELGHVAIFDQYGRVLAHPNEQWSIRAKDLSGLAPVVLMRDNNFGVSEFYSPALQADMIAGYAKVENTGWGIIVPQPLTELQAYSLKLQRYAFFVSLLCVFVVGVISWYLACMIVRPISQVVDTAQGISHGEMGKFVNPKRWFIPVEIAALIAKFNAMAGEVYTSRTLLEQRVKQRTAALSKEVAVRKKAEEQVWQQANFDPLTGLPNRRMLNRLLSDALATRLETERVSLMLLDLDQFKGINDTLGHDMGDMLLQIAAQRIQHCILQGEHVARLGGDEFIILLNESGDGSRVAELGEAVLKTLSTPFQLGIERVYISTSIGVAFSPNDGEKIDDLLKHADQAMYVAKQEGRNRLSYFTASLQEQAQVRRLLANDLRQAVAKKQLHLHYQPIVDLNTGELLKAEVLVRWLHPSQGWISPSDFIHVAEETGVVVEIGNWVFSTAVAQLKAWKERGLSPIQLSINTSPKQYYEAECDVNQWLNELSEAGLSSADVVMEITEGLLMENSPVVNEKLLAFSKAGVEVALDDFGTGYSSLAYLQKFDIEYLKIDRMFIHNLEQDGDDLIVCKAIVVMAHKLGIHVIAEGIETEHQANLLREAGCDFAQGYWFAKPLPHEEFELMLSESSACLLPQKR
ncbi:EAL domain-containing protein [Agarivorans albus]|uniref:Diguanylate cyclase/phosphodiesterase n=1 Tax=Agarivorans albus MKT 106 TaxID=1331007 RepID=R9PQF4_AGAAL|nr:EAL domain-containing protein [Agarivorans albus]GAD03632.1 diguanylate cyclase/phosphodiesterase [Agarivorans albus MKT 106]